MPFRAFLAAAALTLGASGALAQTVPVNYTIANLATGIAFPTSMAVAANGDVYICQQGGILRVWNSVSGLSNVATFTVNFTGERGLLGVALDPAFASNRFIYVYYTSPTPAAHNRVARITVNAAGNLMVAGSEVTLLDLNNLSGATNHNGGAMHFGPDGRLYVSVGENANGANSQVITNLLGKILRLNPDPANPIPTDNPASFPGIGGTTSGNNRAIWAVGLRNPFTFAFQPGTGRMFINDVGENTWEEINDGIAGRNYGWSVTEGDFVQASFPNFTRPLVAYQHSGGTNNVPSGIGTFTGNVIAGGAFYTPAAGTNANFPISFSNDYFFSDAGGGFIRSFDPAANNGGSFGSGFGGNVDLALAPNNTLLALRGSGGSNGSLTRITYIATNGACCAADGTCSVVNGTSCGAGSTFIWGGVCSPNPCPQPTGACCTTGTCTTTTSAACGGTYQGNGTVCTPNPCPQPTGACCAVDGGCTSSTLAACGGTYQGNGTVCTPNPCPQPTGACCNGSTCSITTAAGCVGANRHFVSGAVCNVTGNNVTPCCKADFNQSGTVSVQDLFDFLAAYFSLDAGADVNGSGGLSVQDLFDFLAVYFAGCA